MLACARRHNRCSTRSDDEVSDMNCSLQSIGVSLACVAFAATAAAQPATTSSAPAAPPAASEPANEATPPAATTFFGDTGFWFVPLPEIWPAGARSASGYPRGTNFFQ